MNVPWLIKQFQAADSIKVDEESRYVFDLDIESITDATLDDEIIVSIYWDNEEELEFTEHFTLKNLKEAEIRDGIIFLRNSENLPTVIKLFKLLNILEGINLED